MFKISLDAMELSFLCDLRLPARPDVLRGLKHLEKWQLILMWVVKLN